MIKKPSIVKQLKYSSIIGCMTIYYSLGMYSFGFNVGQEESIPSSKILVQDTTNNKIKSFTGYTNNLWLSLNGPYSDDILSTLILANNYILIGTPHNIVMSSDNGITWSQIYGPSAPVETINRDVNGNILAVIGNGMQYAILSLDFGKTWNPIRFNNDSVLARIFLSENGSLIIQKKNGEMYHTRDYGKTWSFVKIPNAIGKIDRMWFERNQEAITITDKKKILYSDDDGLSWKKIGTEFPYGYLSAHILDNGEFLVITDDCIYRSYDHGTTWKEKKCEKLREFCKSLPDGYLYIASRDKGLLKSTDYGNSWLTLGLSGMYITSVAFNIDNSLIVGTYGHGLFHCNTANNQWTRLTTGFSPAHVQCVAFDSSWNIYAGTQNFGVYRSDSTGNSWDCIYSPIEDENIISLMSDAHNNIFGLTAMGYIIYSVNNGVSWNILNKGDDDRATCLTSDTLGNIYAGCSYGIRQISLQERKLTPMSNQNLGIGMLQYDASSNSFYGVSFDYEPLSEDLHAGEKQLTTLQRSTDGGRSWKELIPDEKEISSIVVDENGILFLGTKASGILRSNDRGARWQRLRFDSIGIKTIHIFDSTSIIVVNQDNQIYATRNLGRQWIRIDFGLPLDAQIDFLSMDKRFYLYVGGWRLGVRKSIVPFPTLMQLRE